MLTPLRLALCGAAAWPPPTRPGGEAAVPRRPAPSRLNANERRRAPDSVLMTLQVAEEACAQAGLDAREMPSVFASAHGDLGIVDALCRTLAVDASLLSPLRFHHSVHNAASGYWAIATGCTAASTALAAGDGTLAAGLLEAACQCVADGQPVLMVAFDTDAPGPLRSVHGRRRPMAVALVLAPAGPPPAPGRRGLCCTVQPGPAGTLAAAADAHGDAAAPALPDAHRLFAALSDKRSARLALPLSASQHLSLELDLA